MERSKELVYNTKMTKGPTSPSARPEPGVLGELSEVIEAYRRPTFSACQIDARNDRQGQPIISFSDGIYGYHVPVIKEGGVSDDVSVPEVNPLRDEIFFLVSHTAVLVIHGVETRQFLLHLFNPKGCPLAALVRDKREEAMALFKSYSRMDDQMLAAIKAMPMFYSGHDGTFVVPHAWAPTLITEPLSGESEEAFEKRAAGVLDPLATRKSVEAMPEGLINVITGPRVILKSIMLFTSFYAAADAQKRKKIEAAFENARSKRASIIFINAFSACEAGWDIGDAIVATAEREDCADILVRCEELFLLQRNLMSRHLEDVADVLKTDFGFPYWGRKVIDHMHATLDKTVYGSVITRQRAAMLKLAAAGQTINDKIFNPENVFWGAIFRGLLKKDLEGMTTDVETLLGSYETSFRQIEGRQGLIVRDAPKAAMRDPKNYPYPELFSAKDYECLVEYLHETYDKTDDQGYRDFLIRQIPRDLQNQEVQWTLIRKQGRLVGAYKVRPHQEHGEKIPGAYYAGTFYVSPELRQHYAVGEAARELSLAKLKDRTMLVATASLANDSLELHIDRRGAVGKAVTREKDEVGESDDVMQFQLEENPPHYASKSLDRSAIRQMAEAGAASGTIQAFRINTSPENKSAFSALLKENFAQNKVLTRLFYDRDEQGKPDLSRTYVVFEKPPA